MLIKSITLHNFRQFKGKQKLEFSSDSDKNVTVLLGDNTFGKTTILQSFNWCLYGVADFPKDSNPEFLLNLEVANELAGVQQKCEVYVELILEHKGMEYIILRKQPYIDRGYGNWTALQSQLSVSYKESGITKQVREGEEQRIINSILRAFWSTIILEGILPEDELRLRISKLALDFTPSILVDQALATGILMTCNRMIMISRDTFLDAFEKVCDPDDRAAQILQFRTEGESLQNIGDLFELTRERVRQITVKLVHKFPLLFEDYFSEPYQYFHLLKAEFCGAFPDVAEEGYEYLSIRYQRGKIPLTSESLSEYKGTWKTQLNAFLHEKEVCNDKKSVSKTEMVMRVLISAY
ncbi:AAA family ATPase [Dysosmobacter sp. HCP28S3_G4]|uniref:AAA family ATPase n=1 Tax=Dysosmobacter sp. HCP28S3_G4 TaxID=3438938 RepID=UPI003F8AC6D9